MDSDEIVWQDPPPKAYAGRRSGRREAMKANPGRWMLFLAGCGTGNALTLTRSGFEATCRNCRVENGKRICDVYARWPEDNGKKPDA